MENRIEWIDAAKGLGIFLVVFGHALPASASAAQVIWAFHMPFFFFLSGVTARVSTPRSVPSAVWNLKSVIVPYCFFSLIAIAYFLNYHNGLFSYLAWADQLEHMAYGVAGPDYLMAYDTPLWFFTCLVMIRLCFILITAALPNRFLQVVCALLLAVLAHEYIFNKFLSLAWNLDIAFVGLVFFVVGHNLHRTKFFTSGITSSARLVYVVIAGILLAVSVVVNGRIDMNYRVFGTPPWFYVGAFSGIAVAIEIARRCGHISVLRLLGRASIVIFPVHILLTLPPYRLMPKIAWQISANTHSDFLAALIVTFLEIAACLPVYFAINRWAPVLIGQFKKAQPRTGLHRHENYGNS